jgi:hypothetical protein
MAEVVGDDNSPMEGSFEDEVKSVLNVPDEVRVVALLGVDRRKGPDKPLVRRPAPKAQYLLCGKMGNPHQSVNQRPATSKEDSD